MEEWLDKKILFKEKFTKRHVGESSNIKKVLWSDETKIKFFVFGHGKCYVNTFHHPNNTISTVKQGGDTIML